jgi:hypothetical protein
MVHGLIDIIQTWHQALGRTYSVVDYAQAFNHVDRTTVLTVMALLVVDPVLLT